MTRIHHSLVPNEARDQFWQGASLEHPLLDRLPLEMIRVLGAHNFMLIRPTTTANVIALEIFISTFETKLIFETCLL